MKSIENILSELGPSLSSAVVSKLVDTCSISSDVARKRLSRARSPIERISHRLFPRNEAFIFLKSQYKTEWYWANLLRDLRDKNTVYACALDGILARGGIVKATEFAVISGAPFALKKQVSVSRVEKTLIDIDAISEENEEGLGRCFSINPRIASAQTGIAYIKAICRAECIILEELREWVKKNNLGSYGKITIRGEMKPLQVGQFKFDLTGPCYFRPLREQKKAHGFVVADVFANGWLELNQIKYFLRKIEIYEKTANSGKLYPILLADGYESDALHEVRRAGIMVTTLNNLFGRNFAQTITNLIETLHNVISTSSVDKDKLEKFFSGIYRREGRMGNMRGILFELISACIASHEYGGQVSVGVSHIHRTTNKRTDLDVVCKRGGNSVTIIECKGKGPSGEVSLAEIESWLKKTRIMRDFVRCRSDLYDREVSYEIWTTSKFSLDARERLVSEQSMRVKQPIFWKNGKDVRRIAVKNKLGHVVSALDEHFLKHPLN